MAIKTRKKRRIYDDINTIVAQMYHVSPNYVGKVRRGDRTDERILSTVIEFQEAKNKLIKEIERVIPVESLNKKRKTLKYGDLTNESNR